MKEGFLGQGKVYTDGVNQETIARHGQSFDGAAHSDAGSLEDVPVVDFESVRSGYGPGHCALPGKRFGSSSAWRWFAFAQHLTHHR